MPISVLLVLALAQHLGPDPGKELALYLGHVTFSLLLSVIALPLLVRVKPFNWLGRCRRMLGLFVFFYASLHLLSYAAFFVGFDVSILLDDLVERPYIYLGFGAWCLLLLMALSSNSFSQRLLKRRWKHLHQSVYLVVALALLHVYYLARSDLQYFLIYFLVLILLLLFRRVFLPKRLLS